MAFHEVRFPVDISYGSQGGPGFNTSIIILGSGYEQRNINWENARAKYEVSYGVKTSTQLDSLISFFRARSGRAHGFRYKDWADYCSSGQPCVVVSSCSLTYQFQKQYFTSGATSDPYDRDLKKIVSGTVIIFRAGSSVPSTSYSMDLNAGIVTMTSWSTTTLTHNCEFDVPCRFDTDELQTSLDNYNASKGYIGGASVPLIEVRTT